MTREELFRAVGEVREDQIAEHFTRCPWKRYGALAACLVAVLAGVFGWNRLYHTGWDLPFAAEDGGFVDGSDYSAPESAEDSSPSPVTPRTWRSGNWTAPPATGRRRRTPRRASFGWTRRRYSQWIPSFSGAWSGICGTTR